MSENWSGRRILITGGAGALGRVLVERLIGLGATVAVNDVLDRDAAMAVLPPQARFVPGDAAVDPEGVLSAATAELGGLPDSVCLHAGIVQPAGVLEATRRQIDEIFTANVTAAFLLAQAVARRWVDSGSPGLLIFTSSWIADVPWPGVSAYSASKAALNAVARSFARELAPHRIRANVVAPGIVGAGMALRQWQEDPLYRARAGRAIPLGELQSPDSVADSFCFLLSSAASYLTGAVLLVDGGASLYPMDDDR